MGRGKYKALFTVHELNWTGLNLSSVNMYFNETVRKLEFSSVHVLWTKLNVEAKKQQLLDVTVYEARESFNMLMNSIVVLLTYKLSIQSHLNLIYLISA